MAPSIGSTLRSFWHDLTSNDRHASVDSPYRTGNHVPLSQSRHANAPLTSVATDASESRTDLTSNEGSDPPNSYFGKVPAASTSGTPYSPGMRSAMQRRQSEENASGGEIQMQAFSDGLPPPPPVGHSWKRIDRWAEDHYEELWDQLGGGCTQNDINELEHDLDCTLPMEVRESLQVHDGQERGGRPTGIIFGAMLLDCEEIVQEWKNWRVVENEYLNAAATGDSIQVPLKAFDGASSSSAPQLAAQQLAGNANWREELLGRQDSQPANAIKKVYAHPAWIPLARDWGGNNLAVDLSPGPSGKWGQVILMGRDYDCKYVVARSWAALLATVADDISTNKVFVHEESGELKLREFKQQNVEPAYFDILRWRSDQKYGRKPPRRKSGGNADSRMGSAAAAAIARGSPYSSPTANDSERGRAPNRFPAAKGTSSPRGTVSSPLARVAEETPLRSGSPLRNESPRGSPSRASRVNSFPRAEKLVSAESTPRASVDAKTDVLANGSPLRVSRSGANKENVKEAGDASGLGVKNVEVSNGSASAEADEMKTVEI